MEAYKDGQLTRQHHTQAAVRISCTGNAKYRVQRAGPKNDEHIILCPSVYVSRSHCEIFRRDRAFWIKDLGSSNGTFLNGTKLTPHSERELRFKDIIGMGISHIPTDETITATDEQCYIFVFDKEEVEREVIDLEEDDEETQLPNNVSNAEIKQTSDDEDVDIKIIKDLPKQPPSPVCNVVKSFKKPMPPPPPPPIISNCFDLNSTSHTSTLHTLPSTSRKNERANSALPDNVDQNQKGSKDVACNSKTPKTVSPKTLVDQTNTHKRPFKSDNHQHLSMKRSKKDTCNSSSDDSSDGLGDVDSNVISRVKDKHKQHEYSGISSDDNSSEENDTNKEAHKLTNRSAWIQIPTEKQENSEQKKKKYSDEDASASLGQKYRPRTHLFVEEDREDSPLGRRRKYDDLRSVALHSTCHVKLEQTIIFSNGQYVLTKSTYDALEPLSRLRMQAQFRKSLQRNADLRARQANVSKPVDKHFNFKDVKKENQTSSSDSDIEMDFESTSNEKWMRNKSSFDDHGNFSDKEIIYNDHHPGEFEGRNQNNRSDEEFQTETTVSKPETPEVVQTKTVQRGIQLLEDAPLPRFAAQAQSKFSAFKQPIPPTTPKHKKISSRGSESPVVSPGSRSFELMSREEQKKIRNERLKEMELQKQKEKDEISIIDPPRPPQPAKIKVTSRNRNQGLMDSIIGATDGNTTEPVFEPATSASVEKRSEVPSTSNTSRPFTLQDPRLTGNKSRVIPRDPNLHKNVNNKSSSSSLNQNNPRPNITNAPSKSKIVLLPSAPKIVTNVKPGANPIMSPPTGIGKVAYKERPMAAAAENVRHFSYPPSVSEDDINRRILTWRPIWLDEQKTTLGDPPVLRPEETLTSTLKSYDNYDAYFKIYYHLLLSEIWATISTEVEVNKSKIYDSGSRINTKRHYLFKIEDASRAPPHLFGKSKKNDTAAPDEDNWVHIQYHTVVRNYGEIDARKDLVVLILKGTEREKGITTSKKIFGFSLPNSERYDQISKTQDCDRRLNGKGGHFKFTEMLVCRVGGNFVLDKTELGDMTRICNITPKLREFKALNNLRSYSLSKIIIKPDEDSQRPWKFWLKHFEAVKPDNMISVCRKLNREQVTIVKCVSERISTKHPELMLMHGPPGTGKTTTIVGLVLHLIMSHQKTGSSKNRRILICTPSNAAIDEIMRRLCSAIKDLPNTYAVGKKVNMVRIGDGVSADLKQYSIDTCVEELDEQRSTAKSIKVEITAIENEIEETNNEIVELKKQSNYSDITLQAKLSDLRDLRTKKDDMKKDYEKVMNKSKTNKDEARQVKRSLVLNNADIICSTLSSSTTSVMKSFVAKLPKGEKSFMCCIVDEASQTTEPETLLPLTLHIDKLLLVGDPHQLGATILSKVAEDKNYGQSLFTRHFKFHDRHKSESPVMCLTRQYRMHETIAQWPNEYFYRSQLHTMCRPDKDYPLRPYCFFDLPGRESSENGQIENNDEVIMVNTLIDAIEEVLTSQFKMTIGIITPYAAQKQNLQNKIRKNFRNFKDLEIDTVDGFQGREKDIIILSCVRTDKTGFLSSGNRLNVALTRAKRSLYVIGDTRCLSREAMWCCLIKDASKHSNNYSVDPDFKQDLKLLKTKLCNLLKANKTAM